MQKRAIPLVDLKKFTNGNTEEKAEFVRELGEAFHTIGFVGVVNHGVPQSLIDRFYSESKAFFALPEGGEATVRDRRAWPGNGGLPVLEKNTPSNRR